MRFYLPGNGGIIVKTEQSIKIFKALADRSRLMLFNSLIDKPQYVEEISERMNLSVSTVSFHLKKLEQANLVSRKKEQYYVMYSVNQDLLSVTLNDLLMPHDIKKADQDKRVNNYHNRVLKSFFKNRRLVRMPSQRKKRDIILMEFAKLFEPEREYSEKEINETIKKYHDDYCNVRREMIEMNILDRSDGCYVFKKTAFDARPLFFDMNDKTEKESVMKNRKTIIKEYKDNPPAAGIFRITNNVNGKIFIGRGLDVRGRINSNLSQLKFGSHRNADLQKDWNTYGPDKFTCEVLDRLTEDPGHPEKMTKELTLLEEMWLDRLKPYGEKGYNRESVKAKDLLKD